MMLLAISFAPTTASAAAGDPIKCKTYDKYPVTQTAGRMCTYRAADYPGYKGSALFRPVPCGDGMPFDIDDPMTGLFCPPPSAVYEWAWTDFGWKRQQILPASRVTLYPYSGTWRWVYTSHWYAVQASSVTIYWFCPASGAACRSGI
jgi:hypothetical protein